MTATIESLLAQNWYSTIELAPGKFTNGGLFRNLAVTRRMLDALEVAGRSCLDIGTMEGVVPTILTRRAANVLAAGFSDQEKGLVEKTELHVSYDFKPLHYYARLCGTSERPPALLEKLPQGIHPSASLNVDDISAAEAVEFDESYLKLRLNDA